MKHNLLFLITLLAAATLASCATADLLNSERIEKNYGSYGVQVLSQNDSRRVSNLYSGSGPGRTMRTLAIVDYLDADNLSIEGVHREIVAGASIGATFKREGWHISKVMQSACADALGSEQFPDLTLMKIELPTVLAFQTYNFEVSKAENRVTYARITEIYHPDYLDFAQLTRIIGSPVTATVCDKVADDVVTIGP